MKSSIAHIQLNVSHQKSFEFYKEMLRLFGYKIWHEDKETLGMGNGTTDFWLEVTVKDHKAVGYHRKRTGLNHVAFRVNKKKDVDDFIKKFLRPRKIKPLYGSPRLWPEYTEGYYAVYFEDPDRIKLEVLYSPR